VAESVSPTAARQPAAGRLFIVGLIAAGVLAVTLSPVAESRLEPMWFWAVEDRERLAERQAHFDKLFYAYVVENQRRARAGRPPLPEEPEALRRARATLAAAAEPLDRARSRPRQIADALRLGGAVACSAGVGLLLATRRRAVTTAASASDDEADQSARS